MMDITVFRLHKTVQYCGFPITNSREVFGITLTAPAQVEKVEERGRTGSPATPPPALAFLSTSPKSKSKKTVREEL